jgi:hypothetical protein
LRKSYKEFPGIHSLRRGIIQVCCICPLHLRNISRLPSRLLPGSVLQEGFNGQNHKLKSDELVMQSGIYSVCSLCSLCQHLTHEALVLRMNLSIDIHECFLIIIPYCLQLFMYIVMKNPFYLINLL